MTPIPERVGEAVELKPCPFCGGTDLYWPHGTDPAVIECGGKDGCGARSGVQDGEYGEQTEALAIAAWNRRALLSAERGGREDNSSTAVAVPFAPDQSSSPATADRYAGPWRWINDGLVCAGGGVALSVYAKAECPRKGDYYGCERVRASAHLNVATELRPLIAAAPAMREALESIRQYGADTLSGRVDGPDDREWQRGAVREMTRRARLALATEQATVSEGEDR